MRPPDDPEVAAWLDKAGRDLRMADHALRDPDPMWDQACFHAQQAAEKWLKALLVARDLDVPRTHDLRVLLAALLASLEVAPQQHATLVEHAGHLTPFGVSPRYPSFLAPETSEDARDALRRAVELSRWVAATLEPPTPPTAEE